MILNNMLKIKAFINNNPNWQSNVQVNGVVVGAKKVDGGSVDIIQTLYQATYREIATCIKEYANIPNISKVQFSSDAISAYNADTYSLDNTISFDSVQVQQTSSVSDGVFTHRITISGINATGSDVTIKTIGLINDVPYMTGPSTGVILHQDVLVAIFGDNTGIIVANGDSFTITLDWVEQ